jgi:hypothetical protein
MQSQIENQVRPLAQHAIAFEVECLREQAAIHQRDLTACVEQIDQCLSAGHAELARFSGRLAALGISTEPRPDCPSDITEIIKFRLECLRVQQKV